MANEALAEKMHQHQLESAVYKMVWDKELKFMRKGNSPYDELRDVSVSDIEVRQIIKSYEEHFEKDIDENLVSIGAVTVGCECEPKQCTNQVFLSYHTNRVQFSRINDSWQVSSLHKWWAEYNQLYSDLAEVTRDTDEVIILEKINDLIDKAPECDNE